MRMRRHPNPFARLRAQFESLFTTMMLKSMRAATQDDLFGSDQQDFYQDMFDQRLAAALQGQGAGQQTCWCSNSCAAHR
jgi:Rod binding domain-containing protein